MRIIIKIISSMLAFVCTLIGGFAVFSNSGNTDMGVPSLLSVENISNQGIMLTASADTATTGLPSTDDSVKGWVSYSYTMQAGYYDDSTGELVSSAGYYCTEWINASVAQSVDYTIKVTIQSGYVWTMIAEKTDGTYQVKISDYAESLAIPGNEFTSDISYVAFYVRKANQNSGFTLTLEEAQNALTVSVGYRHTCSLTATIDEGATDKRVTWSVAWVDGSKTDIAAYVQLNTTSADGLTVTVYNLQPFNKQIKVSVVLVSNPDVYATCTLDYLVRVQSLDISLDQGLPGNMLYTSFSSPIRYSVPSKKSIGTVEGVLNIGYTDSTGTYYPVTLYLNDDFLAALKENSDYFFVMTTKGGPDFQFNSSVNIAEHNQGDLTLTAIDFSPDITYDSGFDELQAALVEVSTTFRDEGKPIGYIEARGTYSYSTIYEVDIREHWDFYGFVD